MKAHFIGVVLVVGIVLGCGHVTIMVEEHPNQWFLESYSAKDGYVFVKDNVRYQAHCAGFLPATAIQSLPPGFVLDPNPTVQEGICSAVLPYLHKSTPVKQGKPFADNELVLPSAADGSFKDGAWEFVIMEAK